MVNSRVPWDQKSLLSEMSGLPSNNRIEEFSGSGTYLNQAVAINRPDATAHSA